MFLDSRIFQAKGDGAAWPELLPMSEAVLFAGGAGPNDAIIAQSLRSGERRELVPNGTAPHYVATGHLIYEQGGNLMAAPFDRRRLQLTSGVVPVLQRILQSPSGAVQYAVSATGSLAYVPGGSPVERLAWVSRNGTEQVLAAPPHNYTYPRLSPDGRRIVVGITEEGAQLWLYDTARDALTQLASDGTTPVWTPDGKRIAFLKTGVGHIFWQPADGSSGAEQLMTSENAQAPRSFSPDGQLLAFTEIHPTTPRNTWLLRLADRKAQPFLRTSSAAPSFSPDGHWLAYTSDESGRWEVYIQPYPGPGGKYQISSDGGTEPVWNPKGREVFYRNGNKMMAVDIATQPSFSVGKPKTLFQGTYVPTDGTSPYYDVSPDGQRFLMIKPSEQTLTQIILVQNWFEELKRRVPTGK